jgi:hypothetical protein
MSIDLNFLREYEKQEFESFRRESNVSKRIGKIKAPIFHITGPCSSIWSQVAFSGTTIFPLHPLSQTVFEKGWNISANDFPSIIQFVKETKKIQFVLTASPTEYKKLDYLEPFLRELKPPLYTQIGGNDKQLQKIQSQCAEDIYSLIPSSPQWMAILYSSGGKHIIQDYINSYALLRYLGLKDIADTFLEYFIANPEFSRDYLITAYDVLAAPIIDPFNANQSYCIEKINNAFKMGIPLPKKLSFPEVGSFLIRKCTHYPESLEACKRLIDRYDDNDLYKVNSALNAAVIDRNDSSIIQKRDEMGEILDNVWEDTTIQSSITGFRYGIDMTCGIVGHAITPGTGFLAFVLPELINATNSRYLDQFSEFIAKKIAYPYMATIYDFKKKYPI